jgi:hypothetical protein
MAFKGKLGSIRMTAESDKEKQRPARDKPAPYSKPCRKAKAHHTSTAAA